MITPADLLRVLLLPLLASAIIAGLGRIKMIAWAMPLAAGVGFLLGYAAYDGLLTEKTFAIPGLPPNDGTEWLFWAAIPLAALGLIDAFTHRSYGWLFGAAAGGVALLIAWPLVSAGSVHWAEALAMTLVFAVLGAAFSLLIRVVRPALGSWSVGIALASTVGAAAVLVMASESKTLGTYGIAAAAALGPAAVLIPRKGRGVTVIAYGLMAGLLSGGHFYADPGVSWLKLLILASAPLLLLPAAFLPFRRTQVRGVIGAMMVILVLAAVVAPTAMAAKRAAEEDPYATQ